MKSSFYFVLTVFILLFLATWIYATPKPAVESQETSIRADSNKFVMTIPPTFNQFLTTKSATVTTNQLIINQKTGRIIQGESVPIYTAAVQYNGMEIQIRHNSSPDTPAQSESEESNGNAITAGKIVNVLRNLSVQPTEIVEIFKIFAEEGSMQAKLVLR